MSEQPPQGPDFTPPPRQQPQTWPPQQQPPQGWAPPPASWPPPGQQGWAPPGQYGYPAPQQSRPSQQQSAPPRRRHRWPVALGAALIVVAVGAGALFVPSMLNRPATAPANASTAMPLVTVTPSPQPTAATVLTTGGDLGSPATFTSSTGTGSLTITGATWTQAGRMAPPDGTAYLILDVTVACTSGSLDVSSISLRTTADPAGQSAFGADLPSQFPGVRLSEGRKQSGQVGFVLAAGQVSVALLDAVTLQPVATRVVPGP